MYNILVAGAGKVGSLIACMLSESKDYKVHLADIAFDSPDVQKILTQNAQLTTVALDVKDETSLIEYIENRDISAVVSSLPFYLNSHVARAAKEAKINYFDLSEDTQTTAQIKRIAEDAESIFVPQCGLAPGFVSILANDLIQQFDECHHVRLRVGAIPQKSTHPMQYSLMSSTEGVLNEYGNPCYGISQSKPSVFTPLDGHETIIIEGSQYEAFYTSGGLGSLGELYEGKLHSLDYKSMRYPGHCEKIKFLMNDLQMNEDRKALKEILEKSIPKTHEDMVIVYVSADGLVDGVLTEKNLVKKLYPKSLYGFEWSALQIATASGVCGVVDMVLEHDFIKQGVFFQESLKFDDFMANRFGRLYG